MTTEEDQYNRDAPPVSDWIGSVAASLLGNEHFRHGVQKVWSTSKEARNQAQQWLESVLEQLPLATTDDTQKLAEEHEELNERIYALEEKLFDINRKLDLVIEAINKKPRARKAAPKKKAASSSEEKAE